jgi:lysine--8-amino-7-oxononanoate aminotransferase
MAPMAPPRRYEELLEKNRRYLWNPFTQMKDYLADEPVIVERGEGCRLVDVNGTAYLDGNASLWLNVHGHARRELNEAIAAQLAKVAHSTLLGMGSVPAIELAERLVALTPSSLRKVFFSDSGAAAVEVGLKIAFAYWRRVGRPGKRRFVCFENGYHGDTIGAMSVSGIELYHAEFGSLLFPADRVPYPYPYRFPGSEQECVAYCLGRLEELLDRQADETACIVVEPVMQGAGGMIAMPPGFLAALADLARRYEVLLFADEVATGFGRTGRLFACEHEQVAPDLMAVGKGLTGGYLPVAATLTSDALYDAFWGEPAELKALYHGHSFTGNQLGCAAALASLDLFEREDLVRRAAEAGERLGAALGGLAELEHVGEVRRRGLMVGIELVAERDSKARYDPKERVGWAVCRRARELGLLTRPLGDVVVLMPPLVASDAELDEMAAVVTQAVAEVTGR